MRPGRCSRLCEEGYCPEDSQAPTRCPIQSADIARFILVRRNCIEENQWRDDCSAPEERNVYRQVQPRTVQAPEERHEALNSSGGRGKSIMPPCWGWEIHLGL